MNALEIAVWRRSCLLAILACFLVLVPLSLLIGIGYLIVFDSAMLRIEPATFLPSVAWILLAGGIATFFGLPLYGLPVYLALKRIGQDNWWTVACAGALPGLMLRFLVSQQDAEIAYVSILYGALIGTVFSLVVSRNLEVTPTDSNASNRRRKHAFSAVLLYGYIVLVMSIVATLATLAVDSRVENERGSAAVALGLPVPFVIQDRSMLDPPSWPQYYSLGAPQEFPTKTRVLPFIVDTALCAVAIVSLLLVLKITRSNRQQ
jgi:hypothetical protein